MYIVTCIYSFTCGGNTNAEGGGCGKVLTLDQYLDHETQPYCPACYNKLFKATQIHKTTTLQPTNTTTNSIDKSIKLLSVNEAPKCIVCNVIVYKYEEHKALGHIYHTNCYKCGVNSTLGCGQLLSLSCIGEHDGSPYCYTCCHTLFHTYNEYTDSGIRPAPEVPAEWASPDDTFGEVEEGENFWVDMQQRGAKGSVVPPKVADAEGGASILDRARQLYEGTGVNVHERVIR